MNLSQLGFTKAAKIDTSIKKSEISGKDYFIVPGKAVVGDKKYFATIKNQAGYTYGAETDKANTIKKEFTDKNLVVKPESTVYTDTTNVQSFRGKQQFVRHIVDGNIIKKKTQSGFKQDNSSEVSHKPITKKDAKKIKEVRHEFAGEKQRGYIPPPPTFWQKAKEEVGSWFKKKSEFTKGAKAYKNPIETKETTKKRIFRKDKVVKTEVVKPEIALSMKNTGFDKIRKRMNIKLDYASTDTLKTKNPKKYTVTHRYLGTNPLVQSFKYNEKVSPKGSHIVGGTYNMKKNIDEISSTVKTPSTWSKVKGFFR